MSSVCDSVGNFENASLSLSMGAARRPARVSKGGLVGALGWDLYIECERRVQHVARMRQTKKPCATDLVGTNILVRSKDVAV